VFFKMFAKIIMLALALSAAQAAPTHDKRIAQVIAASTQKWEAACLAAGGADKCNPLSIAAFSALLAAPGPCEQQNAADNMMDLAKQLKNDAEMIKLTQIFVQQPRNTPNSLSVPYCQQAPKNQELAGLFQCQFAGASAQNFVGGITAGSPGTIPFGLTALNPPGSCPANTAGPIPDGQQLVDITQNPGTPGSGSPGPAPAPGKDTKPPPETSITSAPIPTSTNAPGNQTPAAPGFALQNGKDAQKLNAKFATLSADSACTAGENACVQGGFAQCVGGKFSVLSCGGSLVCAALPLVNKAGTSVTCTTMQDALTRIANTGATGGLTGSG